MDSGNRDGLVSEDLVSVSGLRHSGDAGGQNGPVSFKRGESLLRSMEMAGAYGKPPHQLGSMAARAKDILPMAPVALKCRITPVENVKANGGNIVGAEEQRIGTLYAP